MSTQLPALKFQEAYDTADINQFLSILRRRMRTILFLTAFAGGCALLHCLFSIPQFTAQGALYLGETQQGEPGAAADDGTVNLLAYSTRSDVETQIELLTTGTLIERAVLETGLNTVIRPVGEAPLAYWRWRLLKGGNTRIFLPGPQSLQAVNATLTGHYRLETGPDNSYKLYANSGLFRSMKPILKGVIGKTASGPQGALLIRFAQQDEDDTATDNPAFSAATLPKLKSGLNYTLDIVPADALAQKLANGALNVNAGGSPTQPTKLATLQFRWPDPYQAKLFVNQMMEDYITTQLQWKTEAASVTEDFVGSQLTKVSRQLAEADQNLSNYQATTGIIDPEQSAQATVTQMADMQSQRAAILLKMQALQKMHDMLSERDGVVNQYLFSQADDTLLSNLGDSLSQAEVKLSQLQTEYTPNAQVVKIQLSQIAELRTSIKSLIENDLRAATQSLSDIDGLIASYRRDLKSQPAESLKVETLKRNSDQLGQLYDLLTAKAEQAQISKAATIIETRIVTPSQLPLAATSPRLVITVIAGSLAGFLLGLALVFIQHSYSGRFESEEQIRRAIALPVYGAVPRRELVLAEPHSLALNNFNPFSEAFQLIKRNIYRHPYTGHALAVLVISANPQDGKTTIAANLAKSLADDGKRVLLMNCDIYAAHRQNLTGRYGLTDWVRTGKRPRLLRMPGENFRVLPAGRTRPERGGRPDEPSLKKIFDILTLEFDYLILDSPPLPIVSDGLLLGAFADLILSVINVSHTMRRAFDLHNELIDTLDKPHGLVINGADAGSYGDSRTYFLGAMRRRPSFTAWFKPS